MNPRTQWRQYRRLREQGRRLATTREDLIAAGVDPDELPVPLYPVPPAVPDPGQGRVPEQARALARVWLLVAMACLGAFAGCVSAIGAMLVVNGAPTWHVWFAVGAGICWFVVMIMAAAHAGMIVRRSREESARG